MSTATTQLLDEFDRLPPAEQREFRAVIVQRAAQLDYGDVTDEELTASANRIFSMLDEEEPQSALGTAEIGVFDVQYRYQNKPFGQLSNALDLTVRRYGN